MAAGGRSMPSTFGDGEGGVNVKSGLNGSFGLNSIVLVRMVAWVPWQWWQLSQVDSVS